eukprot:2401_1
MSLLHELLLFQLRFYMIDCLFQDLTSWTESNTSLPVTLKNHICGYDNISNQIYIYYGVWNSDALSGTAVDTLMSYNLTSSNITLYPSLLPSLNIRFEGHTFLSAPYWFFSASNKFGQFHPSNKSITYPLLWNNNQTPQSTTNSNREEACLCITNDGRYLILTGGRLSTGTLMDTMQIYDIINQQWSQGPKMQRKNEFHGCLVDQNDYLWVVGGYNSHKIEKLNVSNMSNIGLWTYNIYDLTEHKFNFRIILYDIYIFVIGGRIYPGNIFVSTVEQINIISGTVTVLLSLPTPRDQHCITIADNKIFLIGGRDVNAKSVNTIFYSNQLHISSDITMNATVNPIINSTQPTIYPSLNPIIYPTEMYTTIITDIVIIIT